MNKTAITVGTFFVLISSFMMWIAWDLYVTERYILANGSIAKATIIKKQISPGDDGTQEQYNVEYRFSTPSDDQNIDEYSIDLALWKQLKIGDTIAIHYDSNDPKNSVPDGYGTSLAQVLYASVICVLVILVSVLLIYNGVLGREED